MHNILVTRDTKGKIRVVTMHLDLNPDGSYSINRETGLKDGKMKKEPEKVISFGKVKRTIQQQAELEYNSLLKKYLDKGYKKVDNLDNVEEIVGDSKTDQAGIVKPMLAKLIESVPQSTLNKFKNFYISRKVDGVRMTLYYKDGEVLSASRGGGDYNYATQHIRQYPALVEWFKNNPSVILDGEAYIFGKSLQNLSGCARLIEGEIPFLLQYYVYDIVDLENPFKTRLKTILRLGEELNLGFDPNRDFKDDELRMQILPQLLVDNNQEILWKLHDEYVNEGWEGAVLRNPDGLYKPSSRDMIKLKRRKDDTFITVGYELGLRGVEDIVFIMETQDSKQFKAKPVGSREVKEELFKDINNIIGQKADCTFFYLSDDGTPLQPVWKACRYDL